MHLSKKQCPIFMKFFVYILGIHLINVLFYVSNDHVEILIYNFFSRRGYLHSLGIQLLRKVGRIKTTHLFKFTGTALCIKQNR